MSFKKKEFDAIVEAYENNDKEEFARLVQSSDPDSVKKALDYLGIDVTWGDDSGGGGGIPTDPPRPIKIIRVGTGQGKKKKLSAIHAKTAKGEKTWFKKELKKAKTPQKKQEIKAFRSARLAQLRKEKPEKQRIKKQLIHQKSQIKKIKTLRGIRERFQRHLKKELGEKYKLPYQPKKSKGRAGYKYKSSQIKSLEKQVASLKNYYIKQSPRKMSIRYNWKDTKRMINEEWTRKMFAKQIIKGMRKKKK